MSENNKISIEFDGGIFNQNRNRFPWQELVKYAGCCVAWNLDGTAILAAGQDEEEVDRNLVAAGIDPQQVVHSYVERP
jgi:hypothetical protein